MNKQDYLDVIGEAQEPYVLDAIRTKSGKESKRKRLSINRVMLIAAVIALAMLLGGCGIMYLLSMEKLKITDREWTDPYVYTEGPVSQQVIAQGGPQGTANYQAAKEWYDFEIPYVQEHDWDEDFICPPGYEFYRPYSQEMVDKLEEITEKYELKPMGSQVVGQSEKGLLDYLGIDHLLLPGAPAAAIDVSVSYFEGGCFTTYCDIQMEEGNGHWPYKSYIVCSYSKKDCFNSNVFILDNPETWEEWHYTTASGHDMLILYCPIFWESYAICDRGDTTVSVYLQTAKDIYTDEKFSDEMMTKRQFEQLLDTIDFSLEPKPGDPALLTGLPAGYDPTARIQTQDGYTVELKSVISDGNKAWATLGITIPEGTPVSETDHKYWGIGFDGLQLHCEGAAWDTRTGGQEQDDGDGLDNTVDYIICWNKQETWENMEAGAQWTLILEGMRQQYYNQEREQHEYLWQTDRVWKFNFTFDEGCDFREIEFLSEPTELPAVTGETADGADAWGTMTVTAFTLRTHSASLRIEEELGYGDLSSWREDKDPQVVLKDGTAIPLFGDNGFSFDESNTSCQENLKPETPIPLDEVDHILLIDGTKLYPVK